MKIIGEVRNNNLYYKGGQILFNSPFDFSTNEYSVTAVPTITPTREREEWVKVKVKFIGLTSELASIINQGHIEKDIDGRVVGKLVDILTRKPTEIQALKVEEGRVLMLNDPYRSDVTASLDLLCTYINGELYFKNFPIKIGSYITFSSKLYMVSGMIIGVDLDRKE